MMISSSLEMDMFSTFRTERTSQPVFTHTVHVVSYDFTFVNHV